MNDDRRRAIGDALTLLDKRRLVLAIHDPSFPSDPDEDIGQGASTTRGAQRFLEFAAGLGFTGIQLGPQGATTPGNPSPYDGTVLSRSPLTISPRALVDDGLVDAQVLQRLVDARPAGTDHFADPTYAHHAMTTLLDAAHARIGGDPAVAAFRAANPWLEHDALYDALNRLHGAGSFREWPSELDRRLFAPRPGEQSAAQRRIDEVRGIAAADTARYATAQWLAEQHHARLRAACAQSSLKLYGDLQIGLSVLDLWTQQALVLPGYQMGAPPSRTNPEGQPWGYAVIDPMQYVDGGPALRFVAQRMDRMLSSYDGVRIDHPHGHCDPWVYDAFAPDALRAVQAGARLSSSPDLPDHPALAGYAIARPEQIDRTKRRYDDRWVRALDDDQVTRYAVVLDVIVESARKNGRAIEDLLCEVLSTLPYPLERAMQRHGLGRFRVTQKASLVDTADVYRAENARPPDWIMIGNHDTKPVWTLVDEWASSGVLSARRDLLAKNLRVDPTTLASPAHVAQAMLAEIFASPAQNAMIFFADLLGETGIYNRPGVVSDENWRLRAPPDYAERYDARRAQGRALNLGRALATALTARGLGHPALHRRLISS